MSSLNHILIIDTAWLGDVILATSIAESIHAQHPDCRIDYLISHKWTAVLEDHPFINRVYTIDKSKKLQEIPRLIKNLRKTTYDLVINNHRHLSSAIIAHSIKKKTITGYCNAPLSSFNTLSADFNPDDGRHVTDRMQDLLNHLQTIEKASPRLYPPTSHSYSHIDGYICISPFSAWFTKTLPADQWVNFIKTIPSHIPVLLMGGPDNYDDADKIILAIGQRKKETTNLCGKVTMLESISIMRDARMNYVLDSAPLHMCSAVDAPVTVLYLSTSPSYGFSPLSSNAKIVETHHRLDCKPCGIHGKKKCPKGHFKCSEINLSL